MIDRIISFGAYFDWITPTLSFVQDLTNGPSCGFGVPLNAFYSARDIKTLLNLKGIKVWGLMVVDDLIIFRVRKAQAQWALYVLETAQVPIMYAPRGLKRSKRGTSNGQPQVIQAFESVARQLDKLYGDRP